MNVLVSIVSMLLVCMNVLLNTVNYACTCLDVVVSTDGISGVIFSAHVFQMPVLW